MKRFSTFDKPEGLITFNYIRRLVIANRLDEDLCFPIICDEIVHSSYEAKAIFSLVQNPPKGRSAE